MSKNFVIINSSEVANIDFDKVLQTSPETVRYNLSGDKTFVKFEGETPSFLSGKTLLEHSEILEVLSGPEWTSEEEIL